MSVPRIHRCTNSRNGSRSRDGEKSRTNCAGEPPITATTRSTECITLLTRPNARPAAMNATISRSSLAVNRRTIWIGSVAESAWLKLW